MGFYLLSVALLHVPAVQRGVTFLISEALKDILHTELSIGRVDLGYFNRIILDDVRIKDQKKKDLLKAARLSAKIELTSLLHGKISIQMSNSTDSTSISTKAEREKSRTSSFS